MYQSLRVRRDRSEGKSGKEDDLGRGEGGEESGGEREMGSWSVVGVGRGENEGNHQEFRNGLSMSPSLMPAVV